MPISLSRLLVCVAAAGLLAACGGGGTAVSNTLAVTSLATDAGVHISGTVTGFGSVIIDGHEFDDGAASVSVDTNSAALAGASLSDVKLGMQVEGRVNGGKLTDLTVRAATIGAVGAVDVVAGTFTVYRQVVRVVNSGPTPTVFGGVSSLAALASGDVVEVHGTLGADAQIVATRVERKSAGDLADGVRVGGIVSSVDDLARSFRLNDLRVDFSGATVLPAGKALAAGQAVTVYAKKAPIGGVLVAQGVKIAGADDGTQVDLGGRIMTFNSVLDFTISGVHVDASAASFDGGTVSDLAAGVVVAVQGQVSDGRLKAKTLRVLKTADDVRPSLAGAITDFVTTASFKVRGAAVDASAAVVTGGTAADLGNGANVKISGKVQGDILKADTVEFTQPPTPRPHTLRGEIISLNVQGGTFRFVNVSLRLAASVVYVGGTAADLADGKRVEITTSTGLPVIGEANPVPPLLTVTKVSFLGELAPQDSVVSGRVSSLNIDSFRLPGLNVRISSTSSFSGGVRADLANGVQVLVTGSWNAQLQALVATTIEIRKPEDKPVGVTVAGAISDLVSKSAFRIGGQKVDATDAIYNNGTQAELANGVAVEASGALAGPEGGRYVKLAKLRFLK